VRRRREAEGLSFFFFQEAGKVEVTRSRERKGKL
jgi:hypothetical protein